MKHVSRHAARALALVGILAVAGAESVSGGLTGGGNLWLQIGSRHYTGRFTPLGLALTSTASSPGSGWQLWAHTVRRPAA
jgi:hypothetical protein